MVNYWFAAAFRRAEIDSGAKARSSAQRLRHLLARASNAPTIDDQITFLTDQLARNEDRDFFLNCLRDHLPASRNSDQAVLAESSSEDLNSATSVKRPASSKSSLRSCRKRPASAST